MSRRTVLSESVATGFSTSLAAVAGHFEHDTPRFPEDMVKNVAFIEEHAPVLA
jgi:hypothetical protein